MPELPEVETVRRQLKPLVEEAIVSEVWIEDERALKRHRELGSDRVQDFRSRLSGRRLGAPTRRGKFMWIPLDEKVPGKPEALLGHLGMSGQLLARAEDAPDDKHVRGRIWLETKSNGLLRLDFADQRRFGSLAIDDLIPTPDGFPGGLGVSDPLIPSQAAHIARDTLDDAFDADAWVERVKQRKTGIKKLLLDQTLMSGVGNIYADEALWKVGVHPDTAAARVSRVRLLQIVAEMRDVFMQALEWGGTSFDEQYVNVNGEAGYFAQSLEAYGRQGKPCSRCGSAIKQTPFMGRNSHYCPVCQRRR